MDSSDRRGLYNQDNLAKLHSREPMWYLKTFRGLSHEKREKMFAFSLNYLCYNLNSNSIPIEV